MRILVIHPHLNVFGGSERLTRILVYELIKHGHEVAIVTKAKSDTWFPDVPGLRFFYIKYTEHVGGDIKSLMKLRVRELYETLSKAIDEFKPSVVLSMLQEPLYITLTKIIDPELGGAMYIHYPKEEEVTAENLPIFVDMYRFPRIFDGFYRVANLHIVNSFYTARALYHMFGLEGYVVYPAIEWDFFLYEPELKERRNNVIVYVGRFVPQKRQDVLIEWFKKYIRPEVPDARLILVGTKDPRHLEYYRKLTELSTEGVEIIDRVLSNIEMIKLYREAKVYIHPRIGEHFGMAPVEAMAQGAVPVLPEKSGLAELITPGVEGYAARTDEDFIKLTIKLLKMSEEEILKMRMWSYRKAWHFNPGRFCREMIAVLKTLLAEEWP